MKPRYTSKKNYKKQLKKRVKKLSALQEGHLFGRKDVAIPISAVTGVEDGIGLNISKQQVKGHSCLSG